MKDKIFDFNIHLPLTHKMGTIDLLSSEFEMSISGLQDSYRDHYPDISANAAINIMLFNERFVDGENLLIDFIQFVKKDWELATFTQLFDFRNKNYMDQLDYLIQCGVRGIKFHSYIQKIEESDFDMALKVATGAAERGLFICVDASYGSTFLYDYDNLRLAAVFARQIRKAPIVILHSGGSRCLDAMHIALDAPNVFLETSFTLPFYSESSVMEDLNFAYKKIGFDRVIYASDHPYVPVRQSISSVYEFFDRNKISPTDIRRVLYDNAERLACST